MLKLSYSMNSLANLNFFSAVDEAEKAGYEGIELYFEPKEFDPYRLTSVGLKKIKKYFQTKKITPVAISTATICFLSDIPHEPSLLTLDLKQRQRRINLIKKGIEIAKVMGIPVVSFQSGYLREEHVINSTINTYNLLIEGIKECLEDVGDVILVIEPEPGMYIETLSQAIDLIKQVNSPNFKLHIDICHAYCSEENYVESIADALSYTAYMHLADIKEGYNLKLICLKQNEIIPTLNFKDKGYLLYYPENDLFLFFDKKSHVCFHFEPVKNIHSLLNSLSPDFSWEIVNIQTSDLLSIPLNINLENKAYLDSIGGVSLTILNKAKYILDYLRINKNKNGQIFIEKPICNTIKGKVHYHEIPGEGEINFKKVLNMLVNRRYSGYITIELYNHSDIWKTLLPDTRKFLLEFIK